MPTPTLHLYVDDSGTRYADRLSVSRKDGMDHFAMGGLLIREEDVEPTIDDLQALRQKHAITAPLHSTKIRSQKNDWAWLGVDHQRAESFYSDLTSFLCSMRGHATACVVHRPGYQARYSSHPPEARWLLCKSAYWILVERATKLALKEQRKLIVHVEETGRREDRAIRDYHTELRAAGANFNPRTSGKYSPLIASDFESTLMVSPKFFTKNSLLGQVADLLLYPIVKGRYDPTYRPYCDLIAAQRTIDSALTPAEAGLGVKYYCFDGV